MAHLNMPYEVDSFHFAQLLGPGFPIPAYESPGDVRKEARERSRIIHKTFNSLHAIVTRHEETIQKRWLKKSGQQKRKILLECWPGMSAVHRPDFEAFRKETKEQRVRGTKYREAFVWPYINQEDLSKPKSLLLLLNARARHHPSHFAATDSTANHFGKVTHAIQPVYLNEYVMILNGATDPAKYGELIAWDDHPDAFEWMHTQKQFLPGDGLLVLETQERILRFLLDFVRVILHDIPEDRLTSETYPVQPELHLKTEVEANGFESLVVMAAEAPYRLPSRIDFKRMELLLEARVSAAKDHIWALREEPDYFADKILEIRDNSIEMLKDTKGNIHPALRPGVGPVVMARAIPNLVLEAYAELEFFTELHRQAKKLRLLHDKYAPTLSPAKDLPEDFLDGLLTFRHLLGQAAKEPLGVLRYSAVGSPPLRRFFVRKPPANATAARVMFEVAPRPGATPTKVEEQVIWLLRTLWEDSETLFFAQMPLVLDELERLIQAEPQAADLISSRIAEVISNASIIAQCMAQVNQYQPWARAFESAEVEKIEAIKERYAAWEKPLVSMIGGIKEKNFTRIAHLAETSDRRFFYPSEKRRTKENVEALRRAEQNLDEFWRAVDEINRMLQRTPEWVDNATITKKQSQRNDASTSVESLVRPLSTLYFSGETAPKQKVATTAKVKTKTKGEAKDTILTPVPDENVDKKAEPTPIRVDSRALKVFRTLFFNPGVTSTRGEVSWQDSIYAMTSTGIFSAEKLYGSAWQFQRLDTESQTRIQFHQPHPRGKIPFTMARRMGRRLTRAFGWIGDMFVLRGNE
ncbi:hypothetical protein N656DRAFT_838666 [Canariomyces notabilis]|uniref:Uncharacterized protein n=1 Tax=Canariomyces notabilis TaxID=2074819 RepID=A0AAN6QPK3_9PEZI|nr:hypothetical protein N656DRAFT_838666 [Canariomyces arenarius]